ncbi:hypothetical protein [Streptomyces noursei]
MTNHQMPVEPDPSDQPGAIPSQPAHYPLPGLESLQGPAGGLPHAGLPQGAVVAHAVAWGGSTGGPVVACAVAHPTPVPAAAPAVAPPVTPVSDPAPAGDDPEPAAAPGSWHAVGVVCALLLAAVVGGLLTVGHPRLTPLWQAVSGVAAFAGTAVMVAQTAIPRLPRRGGRR